MHRKVKVLIAGWLASRIETRSRRLRRALRDHQRAAFTPPIVVPAACGSTPHGLAKRRKRSITERSCNCIRHPNNSRHDETISTQIATTKWEETGPLILNINGADAKASYEPEVTA